MWLLAGVRLVLEPLVALVERGDEGLLLLLEVLVLQLGLLQPGLDVVGAVLLVLLPLAVALDDQELQQEHQRLHVRLLWEQHKDGLDRRVACIAAIAAAATTGVSWRVEPVPPPRVVGIALSPRTRSTG